MAAGPNMLTLEQLGTYSAKFERGEISKEEFSFAKDEEQAQQRHGVRPAAQCHKYLVVQREELVALDVLYYLLHIQRIEWCKDSANDFYCHICKYLFSESLSAKVVFAKS